MLSLTDNLKKRLLTILVGAPLIIGILYMGGILFYIFLMIGMALSFYEWFSMAKKARKPILLVACGTFYIFAGFASIWALREMSAGFSLVLLLFLAVWASDILAYILGKTFKGPKMSPTISPNKTWAGYIGALLGAFIPFVSAYPELELIPVLLVFSIIVGVVGQSGDLMVSALKRHVGVKDTGSLFPGHGGILDRIDALLLVAPVYFFLLFSIAEQLA